jgi:hypothetical protein
MRIIYCLDPLDPRRVDPAYEREQDAARSQGFATSLISYETLVDEHDAARAVRRVESSEQPDGAIYRGWMLRPEAYSRLYLALRERGIMLINTPDAYLYCHYLPASYEAIANLTPRTVWIAADDGGAVSMDAVLRAVAEFGERPIVIKDYVKSRKHEWAEACYIPSAADSDAVENVVGRFLELQGDDLNEGLVFREFVPFEPLTTHSKSGMPLTREFRLFILDGEPILTAEYWEEGDYSSDVPPIEQFDVTTRRVWSRFFTMDVAKRVEGAWMIVELGDGQVAGLPDRADVNAFYRALARRLA